MKKIILIISLIFALLIGGTIIYVQANPSYYPEPARSKDIPDSVKWNTYTGEYYNADSFEWNPDTRKYEIRAVKPSAEQLAEIESVKKPEVWLKENKNSTDVLSQAIIAYNEDRNKKAASNQSLKFQSFYDPEEDDSLKIITDLGVQYIPSMINKIQSDDTFSTAMMYALAEIASIKDLNSYVSAPPNGTKLWLSKLKDKLSTAEGTVRTYTAKAKQNVATTEEARYNIKSLGLFAVPFLIDEINNGDIEAIEYLPDVVFHYAKVSKDKLTKKDALYWKNWSNENKADIDTLRTVVKSLN